MKGGPRAAKSEETSERRNDGILFYSIHTHSGVENGAGPRVRLSVLGNTTRALVTRKGEDGEEAWMVGSVFMPFIGRAVRSAEVRMWSLSLPRVFCD